MPTNLYGGASNFHPENSHVIPALLRRFHEAKLNGDREVVVWGSGTPMREFLHVDDMAAASIHVMELSDDVYQANTHPMLSHINVGTGVDCTIRELAETMAKVVGFTGQVVFDATKPDGTPRKLMDVRRLADLSWRYRHDLEAGLTMTYPCWFWPIRINSGHNMSKKLDLPLFKTIVAHTPLVSIGLIVLNRDGKRALLGSA